MMTITDLGEIGAVGGILRPITLLLERDGTAWNLTGYIDPVLRVWEIRTKTIIAINGALAVTDAVPGEVTYTPGTADPIAASSGVFEARAWLRPATGDREPSGLFRFSIGPGPSPA